MQFSTDNNNLKLTNMHEKKRKQTKTAHGLTLLFESSFVFCS